MDNWKWLATAIIMGYGVIFICLGIYWMATIYFVVIGLLLNMERRIPNA
jgi:hypothetical protein